jgi:hypothetical protein
MTPPILLSKRLVKRAIFGGNRGVNSELVPDWYRGVPILIPGRLPSLPFDGVEVHLASCGLVRHFVDYRAKRSSMRPELHEERSSHRRFAVS